MKHLNGWKMTTFPFENWSLLLGGNMLFFFGGGTSIYQYRISSQTILFSPFDRRRKPGNIPNLWTLKDFLTRNYSTSLRTLSQRTPVLSNIWNTLIFPNPKFAFKHITCMAMLSVCSSQLPPPLKHLESLSITTSPGSSLYAQACHGLC